MKPTSKSPSLSRWRFSLGAWPSQAMLAGGDLETLEFLYEFPSHDMGYRADAPRR